MNQYTYATRSPDQTAQALTTSITTGLSKKEILVRQKQFGINELEDNQVHWWHLFLTQWRSPFIYLLCAAALIAFFITKDYFEGFMILIIVGINTFLGFFQEYKASQALALLKKYIVPFSKVIRDGKAQVAESRSLVPGDIVTLEPGDVVPADMRIVSEQGLLVDESLLTGESIALAKTTTALEQVPTQPYQATNIAFAGTTVTSGKGTGIVVGTGANTILGSVAGLVSATVRQSSVSRSIGKFSQFIVQFILLTVSIIYVINVIVNNRSFFDADLLIFSVALAVTIIPEMLPTVTTFSLAQGALRLAEHKVIVKRLTAIEDLGSIQILCTDKTGTLTENKLVVAEVWADKPDQALFYAAMMATPASLESKKHAAFGFDQALWEYIKPEVKETLKTYDHVDEVPFEPERRRSSALVKLNDKYLLVVRGAYEEILKVSHNISEDQHQKIMQWIAQRGQEGKRVIAVAYREIPKDETSDLKKAEKNLTFQGIISFVDPIKKTTYEAIKEAQVLGVAIKILTGDSPEVAGAVAQKIGLITSPDKVMNGDKFAQLDAGQKQSAANEYAVFARISPQQKYEIIDVLRKRYEVGYLGDGINDAPALKLANVAICVEGSADVAQEAADIVLLKKSLFVIVDGIKEGRKIFANTIKYIKTTIFSNFGHFYSLAIASIILDYVPMLPLQMLLLNIITDFPMIAIATDNVDPDQLKEPHSYNVRDIALFSLTLSPISTIFDFVIFALFHKQEPAVLQTNWFIGTVITELFIILLLRTNRPFFKASRPSWYLLGIIFGGCCVTLALPYTHFGQEAFHFIPPTFHQLRLVFFAAIGYFAATECAKLMYYHMMHPQKNH